MPMRSATSSCVSPSKRFSTKASRCRSGSSCRASLSRSNRWRCAAVRIGQASAPVAHPSAPASSSVMACTCRPAWRSRNSSATPVSTVLRK
ncbi:hypothetical protein G6F63_016791 [Rhizopus arrhizus]|nr:hypothetical protein G6F63_016791 [Rhizopus arrhizus]